MTSNTTSFPQRFTKIDELSRSNHGYLAGDDDCYFLGEYTARAGFSHSTTNDLIQNLKKPMDRRDLQEWPWKTWAIRCAATALREALGNNTERLMIVPTPPSKAHDDPMHDDRLMQVLDLVAINGNIDVREIVVQRVSTQAAHETDSPRNPQHFIDIYQINRAKCANPKDIIAVFDDVLTTGAHFKAMKTILVAEFPTSKIVGMFLARRVPCADALDFEDL